MPCLPRQLFWDLRMKSCGRMGANVAAGSAAGEAVVAKGFRGNATDHMESADAADYSHRGKSGVPEWMESR